MSDIQVTEADDGVSFFVPGIPRPQGSMKAIVTKQGRVFMKQGDTLAPWRNGIVAKIVEEIEGGCDTFPSGPIGLSVVFRMPRPKSHAKRRIATDRGVHYKMPDIDKLVRAVGDALSVSELIGDDDQIATLHAYKRYAVEGGGVGAEVAVSRVPGGYLVGGEFRK